MKPWIRKKKMFKFQELGHRKGMELKNIYTIVPINNLNKCRTTFGYGVPQLANICCII